MNNKLSYYDYTLPEDLIAYYPAEKRDNSNMLVLNKLTGKIIIRNFSDIVEYLNSGDCIVLNNTKVMKCRLFGRKEKNGALIEAMLMNPISAKKTNIWNCLLKPGKRVKIGTKIYLLKNKHSDNISDNYYTITSINQDGSYTIELESSNIHSLLDNFGHIPLPPYIKREDEFSDFERYQTVYSSISGAVAAPTAGLHFTQEILNKLSEKGVKCAELTLHVGAGTFKPVQEEDISLHKMHSEEFTVNTSCANSVNNTKKNGGKILAVGTTSIRVMETLSNKEGLLQEGSGWTDIFIKPPYKMKVADMLLTNFHLPKSTLLMLVCAFAGHENIFKAYKLAIKEKLRFYSYGDCMLII